MLWKPSYLEPVAHDSSTSSLSFEIAPEFGIIGWCKYELQTVWQCDEYNQILVFSLNIQKLIKCFGVWGVKPIDKVAFITKI